jgi:hypothetical protein
MKNCNFGLFRKGEGEELVKDWGDVSQSESKFKGNVSQYFDVTAFLILDLKMKNCNFGLFRRGRGEELVKDWGDVSQ